MADTPKIWVGEFSDTGAVVFDTRCQPEYEPQQVVLWGVLSGKFDIREKKAAADGTVAARFIADCIRSARRKRRGPEDRWVSHISKVFNDAVSREP